MRWQMWLSILVFACSGGSADAAPKPEPTPVPAPAEPVAPPQSNAPVIPPEPSKKSTETLTTRDGVELEADLYLGEPGAHAVVLLHMIPPHWDRSSWPTSFLDLLALQGWNVCVPDRRGAGRSKGVAKEAYEGEKGRYDVEACVKRLQEHGIGKLGIIGASNGTTSALDYAVWSATEESLPTPSALGFMTGGGYTEKQNDIVLVEQIPSVFTFSTEEREWSAALKGVSPKWVFHEFPGGEHGTKMFEVKPIVEKDLLRGMGEGFK